MVINPTPGRVVWFYPNEQAHDGYVYHDTTQPLAALVAYVWSDRLVNLHVIDQSGNTFSRTSVTLVQKGDAVPARESYCSWMPYQIAQAKKHEGESNA